MSLPEKARSVTPRINLPDSVTLGFHRVLLADLLSCEDVGGVIKVRSGAGRSKTNVVKLTFRRIVRRDIFL
jgi:hypothetical protein